MKKLNKIGLFRKLLILCIFFAIFALITKTFNRSPVDEISPEIINQVIIARDVNTMRILIEKGVNLEEYINQHNLRIDQDTLELIQSLQDYSEKTKPSRDEISF